MAGLRAKLAATRLLAAAVRRSGRGGGTSLPGMVILRLEPHAIRDLAKRLPRGSAVISATNGKTTTAAMVAQILDQAGVSLVHNTSGANMAGGIAATLVNAATANGINGAQGLFEVDEFWLGQLVAELEPRVLLLANLFRDQLDRYGELDTIAERWAEVIAANPDTQLVLNADDPLIADLADDTKQPLYFGFEDRSVALAEMQHASDSKHCRRCGGLYEYETIYLGHLGLYRCPGCGFQRPAPQITATEVSLDGTSGSSFTLTTPAGSDRISLPLPGLYNVYNALAAAALAHALNVPTEQISAGLQASSAAFGRAETVSIGDADLQLLLIKNPAGANEVLRTLALEQQELDVLGVLNDRIADGRDVSWIWDADWELLAGRIRRITCAGTRAAELGLRLKYAGVPAERIRVVPELGAALDAALSEAPASPTGRRRLYAVPTYTAMLALRDELTRRGHVSAYWEKTA
ncbi:MAG: DUF1727 domain-containing protein [Solirubrobacterales bacterium]|nr:DUF1727 domain-containing protein [Solirubrobacterales bacterium]